MRKIKFLVIFLIVLFLIVPISASFLDSFGKLFKPAEKITSKTIEKRTNENVLSNKQNQISINRQIGKEIEDIFKREWCKRNKCVIYNKDIKPNYVPTNFYITDPYEAQRYIKENYDFSFNRLPDMLKIRSDKQSVTTITIYDIKSSTEAINVRIGQKNDYINLCNKLNKIKTATFCNVQYILPSQEAKKLTNEQLVCLAVGLLTVPDPTDLLCFVDIK
ncbi:hypothetical protein HYT25_01570 [Candidatus Pacearchaeota archaeon]|nr:hypothetical protein [Candidatus Pacearchaeota archaeon]